MKLFRLALAIAAAVSLASPALGQSTAPAYNPQRSETDQNPLPRKLMCWNGTSSKWEPCSLSGGGGGGTTNGLTNDQLRASPVPVSGPATNAELRASALPVNGTVNIGSTPGLTDAQLRASALSVTQATPLPAGTNLIGNVSNYGTYVSTPTAVTANSANPLVTDVYSNLRTTTTLSQWTATNGFSNATIGRMQRADQQGSALVPIFAGSLFNGTSWDLQPGNTVGMFTVSKGTGTLSTGQVSVGTNATLIAAARTGRARITFNVTAANNCAFGGSAVTLTTGYPLAPTAYGSSSWETSAAVYGVCNAATTIGFVEFYG